MSNSISEKKFFIKDEKGSVVAGARHDPDLDDRLDDLLDQDTLASSIDRLERFKGGLLDDDDQEPGYRDEETDLRDDTIIGGMDSTVDAAESENESVQSSLAEEVTPATIREDGADGADTPDTVEEDDDLPELASEETQDNAYQEAVPPLTFDASSWDADENEDDSSDIDHVAQDAGAFPADTDAHDDGASTPSNETADEDAVDADASGAGAGKSAAYSDFEAAPRPSWASMEGTEIPGGSELADDDFDQDAADEESHDNRGMSADADLWSDFEGTGLQDGSSDDGPASEINASEGENPENITPVPMTSIEDDSSSDGPDWMDRSDDGVMRKTSIRNEEHSIQSELEKGSDMSSKVPSGDQEDRENWIEKQDAADDSAETFAPENRAKKKSFSISGIALYAAGLAFIGFAGWTGYNMFLAGPTSPALISSQPRSSLPSPAEPSPIQQAAGDVQTSSDSDPLDADVVVPGLSGEDRADPVLPQEPNAGQGAADETASGDVDTDLQDLFLTEGDLSVEEPTAPAVTEEMLADFVKDEELGEIREAIDLVYDKIGVLDKEVVARDDAINDLQTRLDAAEEKARRAETLALAQNEMIADVVRTKDKLDQAEKLIVDLSQRLAAIERIDPADRVDVNRKIEDIDDRLTNIARDVGLVARIAINGTSEGGTARPKVDADVPGSASVYTEASGKSSMKKPGRFGSIPDDVKQGDFIEGYGLVLDIMPTSNDGKLVVMENGSALID